MSLYFPVLNSNGLLAQLPYTAKQSFLTTSADMQSGPRWGYSWRSTPLGRWSIEFKTITDAEFGVLRAFFLSVNGRYQTFSYIDPGGNLVTASELFSDASWTKTTVTVGAAVSDPYNGTAATTCTGTGSNSSLSTAVLPAGAPAGMVLCGSVWVRSHVAMTLPIGLYSTAPLWAWNNVALTANVWRRIWVQMQSTNGLAASLYIGGSNYWTSQAVDLFGAQVAPMGGSGAYQRTPGNAALHVNCRFDVDKLSRTRTGPNQNTLTVPIAEFN